jgi:hypothetical protein
MGVIRRRVVLRQSPILRDIFPGLNLFKENWYNFEMSGKTKIINGFFFFVWIALISLLLYRNYEGATLEKAQALAGAIDKATYWYDIYAGPKKIGFVSATHQKIGDEIIIKDEREVRVKKGSQEKVLVESVKCVSDLQYSIKSLVYESHFKDEAGIKATGVVDSHDIIFLLESPEKRKTFKTPTGGGIFYLPTTFIPALVRQNPAPGSVFSIPIMDFNNLSIRQTRVVLEEIRPVKIGINIQSLYRFRAGDAVWWSNDKGILVREADPSGISFYLQPEKIAKDLSDRVLFDFTSLPVFKANKLLNKPEGLTLLKIRIKGFGLTPELYAESTVTLKDDTLTIKKEPREDVRARSYKLPYPGDKLARYLSPDEWVRSDYKPLYNTGLIYSRNNQYNAFLLSDFLTEYLFNLVRTRPVFVLQSAEDFLNTLEGDYLERTVMFPSYARAAGLPTRIVGGLVYVNGYFYFHTWPEVWFDKWVPVDPTFAQFPADVSHIPLKEGSLRDIISIVDNLKSINIEVLEAE